jgi:phage-related protein
MKMAKGEKDIVWMGDSLEVLSGFPKAVKIDLGSDLYRLQIGSVPLDVKSMKTVGRGVRELRARDSNDQYRTMYVVKKGDLIVVLHSFIKKTRQTSKSDINLAKQRLKEFNSQA